MFSLSRLAVAAAVAVPLSLIASPRAQAVVIAHENFESYAAGSALAGGSAGLGWSGNWTTNDANVTVQTITLTNGLGDPVGETKAARVMGAAGDVVSRMARNFASTTAGTVYMAMLARVDSFEDDDFFNPQLTNGGSGDVADSLGIGFRNNPGNPLFARSGTSGGGTTANGPASVDGTSYLLVAKLTKSGNNEYEMIDLFVNPATTTEPGVPTVSALSTQPNLTALSRFNVRDFNPEADDIKYIDQIRIATTFSEAVAGLVGGKATSATLSAFADAHVQSGASGNTNFGSAATLNVKYELNPAGDFNRKSYIQFDVSAVDLNAINTATLNLTVAPPAGGADPAPLETWTFALYGLRDDFVPPGGKLDEGWLESALTYNNAPGNDTANGGAVLAGDVFGGLPLATFVLTGLGVAGEQISLSDPNILNFLKTDTDGVATFILVRLTQETSGNSVVHAFHSRTSTTGQGPQLVLQSIPEPATAPLALLIAGMGLRRRRAA